jgi:hypothetical protein
MLKLSLPTLLLIGSAAFASAQVPIATSTSTPVNSAPAADLSKLQIPTVNFCELVSHPVKYDNQIVRTQPCDGFTSSTMPNKSLDG